MAETIRVRGLAELTRAFQKMGGELPKELRKELKAVAEPVRRKAEGLAVADIRNIGGPWSRMRVGTRARGVYLAPASRRSGGSSRANLAGLLMNRSMWPAVTESQPEIVERLERMLDRLGGEQGF